MTPLRAMSDEPTSRNATSVVQSGNAPVSWAQAGKTSE